MEENPYQATNAGPAGKVDNEAGPVPPKEANAFDVLAWLIEMAAVALFGYGCRMAFFPPSNVRSYGSMELIEPGIGTIVLAVVALLIGLSGRFKKAHLLLCGLLMLACLVVLALA